MASVLHRFPEVYSDKSEVWRYIDFSKYVDLLDSSCLYFPRVTILRELDPYEGSLIPFFLHEKKDESAKRILKELDETFLKDTFVNCWYLSDVESAALWKLFPKSNEGIAIKSNIENLTRSIVIENSGCTIYMCSVTYGHQKVIARKTNNKSVSGDEAIFTKRRCFEHEKELRLVMYANDVKKPILSNGSGVKIAVDLESMISEIIISPEAPLWMGDVVKRVTKKYGFSFKISPSTLNQLRF